MEDISSKIRIRRKMMALSQGKLAEGITSQPAISRLENGKFTIRLDEFLDVMERLNLSIHDVFCNGDKTPDLIVRERLDDARSNQDYIKMAEILESESGGFWKQSPELDGYKYWHQGLVKQSKGEYRMALRLISTAIEKNQTNEWMYEAVAEMHLAKGNIYNMTDLGGLDSYKDALLFYEKSKKQSPGLVVKILYNLAVSLCEDNEHEKSLKYCNKALDILHKNDSTYLIVHILYMKLSALIHLRQYEEYTVLKEKNKIFFENYNEVELLNKLENYSARNIS
ncbi:helix-turn-helix domain-containing protein [Salinicoccus bachuensis]|uniref:Helix-turn-helix domain-containing protein n=1 Tax=Salinicoccus bachuensis TaxID=3136731 RepID=A0ABZ3CHL6_9STAP